MLIVQILILAVLLTVFIQDIKSRSVYWILFPLLIVLFIVSRVAAHQSFQDIGLTVLINIGFLLIQLLLVSAYFSLKNKRWVNITDQLLGWGDILFLFAVAFYLSVLNFLAFYILSLVISLFFWLAWQLIVDKKSRQIPLAGFQAILLALLLADDWWFAHLNLTDDNWLLRFVLK